MNWLKLVPRPFRSQATKSTLLVDFFFCSSAKRFWARRLWEALTLLSFIGGLLGLTGAWIIFAVSLIVGVSSYLVIALSFEEESTQLLWLTLFCSIVSILLTITMIIGKLRSDINLATVAALFCGISLMGATTSGTAYLREKTKN